GTAMAMWAMTVLVAPVAGPLLGGWITDNISWPWIFYINIPVGIVAAFITWSIYHKRDPGPTKVPLDWVGLVLLVAFVGTMQVMIDKGKELDWFNSGQIVTLAVVSAVSFMFFLAWELTDKHPIVDLRLFARRNFLMGSVALSVAYGLFFGNVVLLPLWLQQYMGYTATWAGLATAPVGILAIILSPWVGKNVAKIDPRKLATVAFLGFGGVLWMRSNFNTQADFATILIPTVLQGAAMAFFFIPLQAIVFSGLTPDKLPSAAGLSNFVRITMGAVGTSLFTTLWENRAILHHARLTEAISTTNDTATQVGAQLAAAGLGTEQAAASVNRMIDQQAYTMAVTDVFYMSSLLFFALIALIWFAKPQPGGAGGGAGGAH
ncbi:MAG TPA: DHA2 family efflux MFS transporter permease subunit, partial [Burkholderiaceae bacterium]|nr:DHA2 family efflux MFS transporter permease subunit [Burkholderiaceae bacterium]